MACFFNATSGVARQLRSIRDLTIGFNGPTPLCDANWDEFRGTLSTALQWRRNAIKPPYRVNTAFGRMTNYEGRRAIKALPALLSRG